MTGRLHKLTGPQITADHEQRIRELERRLSAKQTTLPRRATAEGGEPVAVFENDGTLDGPLMRWTRRATVGDTSWFSVPSAAGYSRIEIERPGILVAVLNVSTWASGGPYTPAVSYGASIIASGRAGSASSDVLDLPGGFVVTSSLIGIGIGLVANTGSASSAMWGRLTVTWFDGAPSEASIP